MSRAPEELEMGNHGGPHPTCHTLPCRRAQERLWAHVERELPAAEQRAVDAHLAVCPACARACALTARARASLAPRMDPSTGPDVTAALSAAVARRFEADAVRGHGGRPRLPGVRNGPAGGSRWGSAIALAYCLAGAAILGVLCPASEQSRSFPSGSTLRSTPIFSGRLKPRPRRHEVGLRRLGRTEGERAWLAQALPLARDLTVELSPEPEARPDTPRAETPGRITRYRSRGTHRASHLDRVRPHRRLRPHSRSRQHVTTVQPPAASRTVPALEPQPVPGSPGAWTAPQEEPVMLVRETDPSAPSFAYARSVLPAPDGESATVLEVTRQQSAEDGPVRVTLAVAAVTSEAQQEFVP